VQIQRWTTTAINTHSEYVKRIDFPRQQWLDESASLLRYNYLVSLV